MLQSSAQHFFGLASYFSVLDILMDKIDKYFEEKNLRKKKSNNPLSKGFFLESTPREQKSWVEKEFIK
jgi:hypothetical protein